MFKFLLLALIAGLVWLAWKKGQAPVARRPQERPPEVIVACAHCGVHVPASDAVEAEGRHYCCPAHRQAGPRPEGR